jgi:predicted component of type VI protein secretion system
MDDRVPETIDMNLPLAEARRREPPVAAEMPPGFVPLRLMLLPSGVTLELDLPDMVLGRHTEADLRLPMPDVSRRHCRFVWSTGIWTVIDLNSLNGIEVNGRAVQRSELVQNDLVRIGGFSFTVDLSYPDAPKVVSETAGRLNSVIHAVQSANRMSTHRKAS